MTGTDQHYARPANASELLGATHAWRSVLRHAAAYLDGLIDTAPDHPTRAAVPDIVIHLQQACALLTVIDTSLDVTAAPARRAHCVADLTRRDLERYGGLRRPFLELA